MNDQTTSEQNPADPLDIPEFLRREQPAPANDVPTATAVEVLPETPVELERAFVSVEQPGGEEVKPE